MPCAGVGGPCAKPVVHHLEDPDGKGPPIPLCQEHWEFAVRLEQQLRDDPAFCQRFTQEVEAAEHEAQPTLFERLGED